MIEYLACSTTRRPQQNPLVVALESPALALPPASTPVLSTRIPRTGEQSKRTERARERRARKRAGVSYGRGVWGTATLNFLRRFAPDPPSSLPRDELRSLLPT